LAAAQHILKCLRHCYIAHKFFLAPTSIIRSDVSSSYIRLMYSWQAQLSTTQAQNT